MKAKFFLIISILLLSVFAVSAQRNVTPAVDRDPLMEADAKHNLDVAEQSFSNLKKAYKAVLGRFEETYAAYPTFSRMDEFLYIAGMSSYYLSINKGKQKIDLKTEKEKEKFAPAKLKEDAVAYLSLVIEKYPDSPRKPDAQKALQEIKGSN